MELFEDICDLPFYSHVKPFLELLIGLGFSRLMTLSIFGFMILILSTALVYMYWKLFHQPFDLFRDFSELGFEEAEGTSDNAAKKNLINEMRNRRKIGKLPPAYPNGWFAILESSELKNGQAKEVYALGNNLVAWRGTSGTSYIADAYCPHIGAHLGVGGEVHGECIQCPFHSWKFDGEQDGKLTCIPYADKLPEFVKIKMWKTFETNAFIFMWYHAENEEPSWYPDQLPEINDKIWSYRGRSEMRVSCHIQEIPENGADVAHLNVLHSDIALLGDNPKKSYFSLDFIKHVWEAKWEANTEDPERKHEGILKVRHYMRLFGWIPFFEIEVDIHQLGPGLVLMYFNTVIGRAVFVQTVTPLEPLLQRVVHRFYSSTYIIHPIAKMIMDAEAKQIGRDIRIWNRKCYLSKPILTKEDQAIKTFRRWFAQFYSENKTNNYFNTSDDNSNKLEF